MDQFQKLHDDTVKFLISIAPGQENSKVKLSKNPFPHPISWCKPFGKWDKGRVWTLLKYCALWRSENVFKEVLEELFKREDGTTKLFHEIGRNRPGRCDKHVAVGLTDYSNARILIVTNFPANEMEYFEDHPLLRVFHYSRFLKTWKQIAASCAIPAIFSEVCAMENLDFNIVDDAPFGDGASMAYLPSSYLAEESESVQIAVSCTDLDLPRKEAYTGRGKYKWKGFYNMIETIGYSIVINSAHADMAAYYEGGNKYCYQFSYNEIDPNMNTVSFHLLDAKRITKAYYIGVERGKNCIRYLTDRDKIKAHHHGLVVALSGGGTLFPAMFGFLAGMAEEAQRMRHPVTKAHMPATIRAMIAGSGGALASCYMAEFLPV